MNQQPEIGEATFFFEATANTKSGNETISFTITLDADYPFTRERGLSIFNAIFPNTGVIKVLRCERVD